MKTFVTLTFLACLLACVLACDPDSNNQPTCSSKNVNVPVRDFWDPTAYWMCSSESGTADLVRCENSYLFDSALGKCIPNSEWVWTAPCPEN